MRQTRRFRGLAAAVVFGVAAAVGATAWGQTVGDDGMPLPEDGRMQSFTPGPGAAESAGSPFDRDTTARPSGTVNPQQLQALFAAAVGGGDVDAIATLYAPDAMLLLPNGETAMGRAAIRAVYAANQKPGANTMEFGQAQVDGDSRRAALIWTWNLRIAPQAGFPRTTRGRSLLYLRKSGNVWQIALEMVQAAPAR
jgi:uncharacterized protein (TIGR02246 family)